MVANHRALPVAATLCAALVSLGSSCRTDAPKPDTTEPAASPKAPEASKTVSTPSPGGGAGPVVSDEDLARRLPGVDLSSLDAKGRRALLSVLEDAVCDCGRPSTLGGCMQVEQPCELGRRMVDLAITLIRAGGTASEVTSFVEEYFEGFAPERRKTFEVAEAACEGPADAPIQLVEFADFECPYCGLTWPIFQEIVHRRGAQVRLCFLNFPLGQHEHARDAAQLAVFARTHGKFKAIADLFFTHQTALDRASLLGYAEQVGLDRAAAAKALDEGTYDPVVEKERKQGLAAGVNGTPSLFINGRRYTLLLDPKMIDRAIDDEVAWQKNGPSWSKPSSK